LPDWGHLSQYSCCLFDEIVKTHCYRITKLPNYQITKLPNYQWDGEVEIDESYFGGLRKAKRGRVELLSKWLRVAYLKEG